MQAVVILLVLVLLLGSGAAKREEGNVKHRADLKVEMDSKGRTSSRIGIGTEYTDPESGARVVIRAETGK
jgi:hypothetical protein